MVRRYILIPFRDDTEDIKKARHWQTAYKGRKVFYVRRVFDQIWDLDNDDQIYVPGHGAENYTMMGNEAATELLSDAQVARSIYQVLGGRFRTVEFRLKIFACYSSKTFYGIGLERTLAYRICEELAASGYANFTGYGYDEVLYDPEVGGHKEARQRDFGDGVTRFKRAQYAREPVWP